MANKVNSFRTKLFFIRDFKELPSLLQQTIRDLQSKGWTFEIVDQRCGYVNQARKDITIPTWVCEPKHRPGRFIQYIAHELAHAIHMCETRDTYYKQQSHGPEFMEIMKRLCPPEYWHFELGYKPREAAAAGISAVSDVNVNNRSK